MLNFIIIFLIFLFPDFSRKLNYALLRTCIRPFYWMSLSISSFHIWVVGGCRSICKWKCVPNRYCHHVNEEVERRWMYVEIFCKKIFGSSIDDWQMLASLSFSLSFSTLWRFGQFWSIQAFYWMLTSSLSTDERDSATRIYAGACVV